MARVTPILGQIQPTICLISTATTTLTHWLVPRPSSTLLRVFLLLARTICSRVTTICILILVILRQQLMEAVSLSGLCSLCSESWITTMQIVISSLPPCVVMQHLVFTRSRTLVYSLHSLVHGVFLRRSSILRIISSTMPR